MKKLFAILCAATALFSCSQSELVETAEPQKQQESAPVTFNITVDDLGGTRALKADWAAGDVIYIKFNTVNDKYLTITYDGTKWNAQAYDNANAAATFVESDFSSLTDAQKSVGAVHFPVAVDATLASGRLSFTKNSEAVKTYFLFQNPATYSVDGTNVTLTLSLQKPENMVLFHIPGIEANVSDYTLYIDKYPDNLVTHCCSYIDDSSFHYISNSATSSGFQGLADADGAIFSVYFFNGHSLGEATDYTFTVKGPVQEYTISGNLTLQSGYQYSLPALNSGKWTPKFKPFTIASGKQVYFAPGNLQAITTNSGENWTWSFAEHQYDCPGGTGSKCDNMNVTADGKSSVTNCTVGLFGWSTDDNTYFGISSSTTGTDWDGSFVDWGTLEIGRYAANTWRTPTSSEYNYLLKTRTTSTVCGTENARYARATVNGIQGNILFPDAYTHPDGVADIININVRNASNEGNTISASDWNKMEAAGAVFLPQAGYFLTDYPSSVYIDRGYYRTSSPSGTNNADYYLQQESNVGADYASARNNRFSVRLIHDIN